MESLWYRIMVVAATVVSGAPVDSQEVGGPVGQVGVDVGVMVGQVVEHHFTGCHLVLITTTQHSHASASIIRHMSVGVEAGVVVEAGWVLSQDQLTQDHLLQGLWGDTRTTCRALILDLITNNGTDLALRYVYKDIIRKNVSYKYLIQS
ncbi:putative Proteasome subunit alpha type-2-like 9 [Homarus americanus]|uniref:Putative Proteasome subunit alpha type-2-like 9 n=1 Tax=Homarus americanus TaxID=6706 RepID=A0A8J5JQP5_HOMAM|nr:putative Proteasome subunit alpha type-2-like 9 [Homarus americanus]